jgi:hypothetical protein
MERRAVARAEALRARGPPVEGLAAAQGARTCPEPPPESRPDVVAAAEADADADADPEANAAVEREVKVEVEAWLRSAEEVRSLLAAARGVRDGGKDVLAAGKIFTHRPGPPGALKRPA